LPINNQTDSDLLQKYLTSPEKWENKWQMSFYPSKYLQNEKKQLIPTSYQLHGETLAIEDASKYIVLSSHHQQPILGQTVRHITNNLSWDRL